jgi:hypothetical protein
MSLNMHADVGTCRPEVTQRVRCTAHGTSAVSTPAATQLIARQRCSEFFPVTFQRL